MTIKKQVALNAKIITTGIAVASTVGIYSSYVLAAKQPVIVTTVQTIVPETTVLANTPAIAPSSPKGAIKVVQPTLAIDASLSVPAETIVTNTVPAATTPAATAPAVAVPVAPIATVPAPIAPPTTAPKTSASK